MIFVNLKISGPPMIQKWHPIPPSRKKKENKCKTENLRGNTPDLKMKVYGFLIILWLSGLFDVRKVTEIS